jgi:hypothetical protein
MLTLLPCLLLLLVFILVQIISKSKLNVGNQWLVLVLSTLFTWGTMLFLRSHLPQPLTIANWLPAAASVDPITFQLDERSWAFSFALISLLAGMILVDTIRLHERTDIRDWSRIILLFLLGLVGCLLNSLLAFVLCWTLIDLIGLIVQIAGQKQGRSARFITVFFLRMVGTLLVLAVMVRNPGVALGSAYFSSDDFTLLIAGAALRMVFFTSSPEIEVDRSQAGFLESIRRVISPMLAIVFLSRLQPVELLSGLMLWFLAIASLMVLTAAIKWFSAAEPGQGEGNLILFFSGMALVSALRGQPDATAVFGFLLPIAIGWPRLYSHRFHKMHTFLILFAIALLGLPFTFAYGMISSMAVGPLLLLSPLLWISMALLVAGVVRAGLKTPSNGKGLENWMKMFFAVGLGLVTVAPLIPGLWQLGKGSSLQYFGISAGIFLIFLLIMVFSLVEKARMWLTSAIPVGLKMAAKQTGTAWEKLFASEWIQRTVELFSGAIHWLINSTNTILEGEGGILWSFVFLALLLSLLISGVGG